MSLETKFYPGTGDRLGTGCRSRHFSRFCWGFSPFGTGDRHFPIKDKRWWRRKKKRPESSPKSFSKVPVPGPRSRVGQHFSWFCWGFSRLVPVPSRSPVPVLVPRKKKSGPQAAISKWLFTNRVVRRVGEAFADHVGPFIFVFLAHFRLERRTYDTSYFLI